MVVAVAGCAPAASPVLAPPEPAGVVLAPRPAELRLDDVDPCTILSPAQRAELGLDGDPVPHKDEFELFGAYRACSISGFEPRAIAADLAVVTERGIEAITRSGVTDELTAITVGGFPAVLARPRNPVFCSVDIDVAAGQFLEVYLRDGGGLQTIPQERLCRDVQAMAEIAMGSLLAR